MKNETMSWIALLLAGALLGATVAPAHADEGMTAAALRIAHQRERAAQQHYVACATRAAAEGQTRAAALFAALAAAEAVHVRAEGRVLEQLGVPALPAAAPAPVRATLANVRAALAAEEVDSREVYPRFMAYARAECLYDALASMRDARDAERTHVTRLALLLAQLEQAPGPGSVSAPCSYFVCTGCGRVRSAATGAHCDCGTPAARFAHFDEAVVPTPVAPLIAARWPSLR